MAFQVEVTQQEYDDMLAGINAAWGVVEPKLIALGKDSSKYYITISRKAGGLSYVLGGAGAALDIYNIVPAP